MHGGTSESSRSGRRPICRVVLYVALRHALIHALRGFLRRGNRGQLKRVERNSMGLEDLGCTPRMHHLQRKVDRHRRNGSVSDTHPLQEPPRVSAVDERSRTNLGACQVRRVPQFHPVVQAQSATGLILAALECGIRMGAWPSHTLLPVDQVVVCVDELMR